MEYNTQRETGLATRNQNIDLGGGVLVPGAAILSSFSGASSIRDYLLIARRRVWVILGSVVIVVAFASLGLMREKPVYEATGRVAINKESEEILGYKDFNPEASEWEDYTVALDTQLRVIQSSTLAWDVIKQLQLQQRPEFGGQAPAKSLGASLPGQTDARNPATIDAFKSKLSVSLIPNTRILQISFRSNDRQLAADTVNTLAEKFIEQNIRTKYESTMKASDWLSKQLVDMQSKVEESQEKLVQYQREHNIVGVDDKQNITTEKLDEINKELTSAEADRIDKESLMRNVASETPESVSVSGQHDSLLSKLLSQQSDLNLDLAQAAVTYGQSHPKVIEIKNKLKALDSAIALQLKTVRLRATNDYNVALAREHMLSNELESQKGQANKLNESAIEYTILKRDVDSNRQLYEGLLQKMKEAGVTAGLRSNNIRVIDPAEVPRSPISPNVPRTLGVAFLGSLTMGLGLAFLLESLDKTIRSADQVQIVSGLPTAGMIPLTASSRLATNSRRSLSGSARQPDFKDAVEVVSMMRPRSKISEAYRSLGTSILLSGQTPPKIIMVTSALPEEGKTTTSANTAIVLAQQSNRVLYIDADLRRPSMHRIFNIAEGAGLAGVLTGECTWRKAISRSSMLPSLHFLPAGHCAANPAELLGSPKMRELLVELQLEFDHIVIDTPPVLTITDAVRLSPCADAVLLVLRSGKTTKEALCRARDVLMQVRANLLGVVVNALDTNMDGYYSYGSRYDNRYYDEQAAKLILKS